jgi:hypothetical protein
MRQDFLGLASQFGYALAYGRDPAAALKADYAEAAASPIKIQVDERTSILVKYFQPNDTGLIAVVECTVPIVEGNAVLLELIVTGNDEARHITVEDISGVTI